MANIRSLNKEKFSISNYRFKELYYFCLQYDEWKAVLEEKHNLLKGTQYTGTPGNGTPGNPTQNIAIECAELSHKCTLIEQAAKMADPDLYEYIIYAVTHENITFKVLKEEKHIPCERDRYYNSRRKFYFLLNNRMRRMEEPK